MTHLVFCDQPADLEQSHVAASRIGDVAVPFRIAPAVQKVDRPPPDPGEVFERLLQGPSQCLVVPGIDGGTNIGGCLSVQVGVAEERVDPGCGVDQVGDQAA